MGVWKTYRYNIDKDGTVSNKTLFANEASDGMTIDNKGNIYLAGNGVTVYNPDGRRFSIFLFLKNGRPTFASAEKTKTFYLLLLQNLFTLFKQK